MAIMSNLYPQNFSYSMHDVLYQDTVRLPSTSQKGPVCSMYGPKTSYKSIALHIITFQQHKQDKHYYATGMDR